MICFYQGDINEKKHITVFSSVDVYGWFKIELIIKNTLPCLIVVGVCKWRWLVFSQQSVKLVGLNKIISVTAFEIFTKEGMYKSIRGLVELKWFL